MEPSTTYLVSARTPGLRAACGIAAALAALSVPVVAGAWTHTQELANRAPVDVLSRVAASSVFVAMAVSVALMLLYCAGPDELLIEDSQRYRLRRGFPLLASSHTGPLSDVECVYLDSYTSNGVRQYQACIAWAAPARRDLVAIAGRQQDDVAARAADLAARLHAPLERDPSSPGVVRRKAARRVRAFGVLRIVSAALCLVMMLMFAPRLMMQRQLAAGGRTVRGTVLYRRRDKATRIGYAYWVTGKLYRSSEAVAEPQDVWLGAGDPVEVTYLPAYPATSRTNFSNEERAAAVPLLVGLVSGVALVVIAGRLASAALQGARAKAAVE